MGFLFFSFLSPRAEVQKGFSPNTSFLTTGIQTADDTILATGTVKLHE